MIFSSHTTFFEKWETSSFVIIIVIINIYIAVLHRISSHSEAQMKKEEKKGAFKYMQFF